MTFRPNPKPVPKAKKAGAMRTKPKALRMKMTPTPRIKVGDLITGAIEGVVVAVTGQTKGALIRSMLATGATSAEMEAATGWKATSVRGYLGTLRKSGVNVISTKAKGQPTVYRINPDSTEVL